MSSVSRAIARRRAGGIAAMVRMLCKRSASLIKITRMSLAIASSILRKFSACASSCEANSMRVILETPSTRPAISAPNSPAIPSLVAPVSSMTSCRIAAESVRASRCIAVRMWATAIGW